MACLSGTCCGSCSLLDPLPSPLRRSFLRPLHPTWLPCYPTSGSVRWLCPGGTVNADCEGGLKNYCSAISRNFSAPGNLPSFSCAYTLPLPCCPGWRYEDTGERCTMATNEEKSLKPFKCNSKYQHCDVCHTKIPKGEWMQATPPTEEPLEGWTNKRCRPDCKQAAIDRKNRTPDKESEGDVPPETKDLISKFPNPCIVCGTWMPRRTHVRATRVDVPDGQPQQKRWHLFHHYDGCPPPASPVPTR